MSDIDKFFQEFEPGDKVRVTRKAKDFEQGWTTIWNPQMSSAIGKVFEVLEMESGLGTRLNTSKIFGSGINYWFPSFVLERVDE